MNIFRINKINLRNGKSLQIVLLGTTVLKYENINHSKKLYFMPVTKEKFDKSKPVFYLKIKNKNYWGLKCLQHWIDIIEETGSSYYIICDKERIRRKILNKVIFSRSDIKFIKSNKNNYIKRIVKVISTKRWKKTTFAHLTAFYHAKKNKTDNFWNIDADDTMFLCEAPRAAEILRKAQKYAQQNNISAFSMDMHTSRTHGIHWSFGISYIDNKIDWFKIFDTETTDLWQDNYLDKYDTEMNLDWYFTYLRDYKGIRNKIFYVENLHFMHYGDFIFDPVTWNINQWHNGKVKYPILKYIFKQDKLAEIPISSESIKIDVLLDEEMSFKFINNYFSFLNNIPKPAQNMWFCSNK